MSYNVIGYKRGDEPGGWYVGLERSEDHLIYWVDVWVDEDLGDVDADWNQYIFYTNNEEEVHREKVQEDNDEFDMATSEAICFLDSIGELYQDSDAFWHCSIENSEWKEVK